MKHAEQKKVTLLVSSLEALRKMGRERGEAVAMACMALKRWQWVWREEKRERTLTRKIYCEDFVDKRLVLRAISVVLPQSATWSRWVDTWRVFAPHGWLRALRVSGACATSEWKICCLSSRRCVFCPLVAILIFWKKGVGINCGFRFFCKSPSFMGVVDADIF